MAEVSSVDMAFAGFGLVRQRPIMMVGWFVALLIINVASSVLTVALFGSAMSQFTQASSSSDPAAMFRMMGVIAPLYLVLMIVGFLTAAIINTSVYRAMIRPETGGPLFLSFGAPELRQALLYLIYALLGFGCYLGLALLGAISIVGSALVGRAIGGMVGGIVGGLLITAAVIGCICLAFLLLVRFSMSSPATFARGELVVFRSWALTRGHFWSLLGGFFLNWAIFFVAYFVLIGLVVAAMTGGFSVQGFSVFQEANLARMSTLSGLLSPMSIGIFIASPAISALLYAYILAPAAYAYHAIAGDDVEATFA